MAASEYVDSNRQAWRDTPYAGVSWKKLRHDPASGASAVLLRFEPGACYGAHRHPGGEQYFVLQGSVQDGADSWGEGSFAWHPPGSVHAPRSEQGCLLFVSLPQPIEIVGEG